MDPTQYYTNLLWILTIQLSQLSPPMPPLFLLTPKPAPPLPTLSLLLVLQKQCCFSNCHHQYRLLHCCQLHVFLDCHCFLWPNTATTAMPCCHFFQLGRPPLASSASSKSPHIDQQVCPLLPPLNLRARPKGVYDTVSTWLLQPLQSLPSLWASLSLAFASFTFPKWPQTYWLCLNYHSLLTTTILNLSFNYNECKLSSTQAY